MDQEHYNNKIEAPRKQPEPQKRSPALVDPRKPTDLSGKRQETYKYSGSTTNNKINERNQKNAKDKDCIIY